jgi:hypothetical protein
MAIATKGHEEIAKAKGRRTASTARAPFAVMLRAKNLTTISGMSRPFMNTALHFRKTLKSRLSCQGDAIERHHIPNRVK